MNRLVATFFLAGAIFLSATFASHALTIDTVPIGSLRNAGELSGAGAGGFGADVIVGSVPYNYRIGTTEVTNTQYVEFLNAVAGTDTYGLYNPSMGSDTLGGIARSGSSGGYVYAVKTDALGQGPGGSDYTYANKPVNYVSWYDTLRFANWLHNGQGSGDTESGAYTLLGGTPMPSNALSISRNAGAIWFLPNENEWYKAAYYDDDTGTYFDYATGTDTTPNNNLPSSDTGNSANFVFSGYTTGDAAYPLIDAGAYTLSVSPYGTFDQAGNVWEWDESKVSGESRGWRGGSFNSSLASLLASTRANNGPPAEFSVLGFRVATVPEPSGIVLGTVALLGLIAFGWRQRKR